MFQAGLAMRGKVQRRKQLSWSGGRGARLWHQEEVRFQRPAWSHGGAMKPQEGGQEPSPDISGSGEQRPRSELGQKVLEALIRHIPHENSPQHSGLTRSRGGSQGGAGFTY